MGQGFLVIIVLRPSVVWLRSLLGLSVRRVSSSVEEGSTWRVIASVENVDLASCLVYVSQQHFHLRSPPRRSTLIPSDYHLRSDGNQLALLSWFILQVGDDLLKTLSSLEVPDLILSYLVRWSNYV